MAAKVIITFRVLPSKKRELVRRQKEAHCRTLSAYLDEHCLADPSKEEFRPLNVIHVDSAEVGRLARAAGELATQYRKAGTLVNTIAPKLHKNRPLGFDTDTLMNCVNEFRRGHQLFEEIHEQILRLTGNDTKWKET